MSSTYLDLREARQQVTMTLLECDAFPAGMEIFPATDNDAWTLIQRVIDESDYYLLVIAGKYGSLDETAGLSYTEKEYDYAVSTGKPVMAFLHGNPGSLTFDLSEADESARKRLDAFKSKVQKAKHVRFWTSPEELGGHVARTFNRFTRLYPATGWIRADHATTTESLKELIEAKARIEELESALKVARTTAPEGAEHLAQGDDKIEISFYASAQYNDPRKNYSHHRLTVGAWTSETITWDSVFAAVAPLMLQEAEQGTLHDGVQDFLVSEFLDQIADIAIEAAAERGHKVTLDDLFSAKTVVRDEVFGTILVQFRALGLIQPSSRKRSVNDTGTYWTLTAYGEMRTIRLRALRRKGPDDHTATDLET